MEFIERALALLLAFLLGFFSFIGILIVGGYYAYTSVSYKSLVEWGVAPNADTYLDPTAEVNVQTLTIQKLLGEISKIQAMDPESLTVEVLLERYGINLPENVRSYLPESVTTISLQTLFSSEGLDQVMEDTNLDYVLQFVPEGVLSEPAKETLSGKNFKEIVSLNLSSLLENVYLGYFLGVNYTLVEDHYEIQYADANNPTLFEMVAGLDLKRVLDSFSGQDNLIGVIRDCLGDIVLTNVTKLFGLAQNAIVNALLQDETVASLIQIDGSGNPSIDIFSLVNGKYVGQILGYTPKYLNDDPTTEIVVGWLDGNNASVNGLMRGAYSILIDGLGGNTMDFSSMLSKVYLGDILGYVPSYDSNGQILEWKTTSNEAIMPLFKTLVNHNIGEVFQENFNYMDLLNGIYIGYALGYTELKENPLDPDEITGWVDSNNNPISGIYEIVAGLEIGGLLTSDDILGDLTNGLTVGKILGITRNNQNVAVDANGNQVNPFYEALMDIDVGKLVTGDPDYPLSVALKDVYVGSLLGYTKVMDPLDDTKILKWTSSDGTTTSDVTGIFAFLSNIELGGLLGSDDFVGTLLGSGLYVGTILGYTENAGVWYDANNQEATGLYKALAGIDVGQLVTNPDYDIFSAFNGVYVGSLLSYTPHYTTDDPPVLDYWENAGTQVSGMEAVIAKIDLGDLISNPSSISSFFNGTYVGELLSYTPVYDLVDATKIDHWEQNNSPVSGINAAIANINLGALLDPNSSYEISSAFNGVKLGDILGYTLSGDVWMDGENPVTGIQKALAGVDLGNMIGGSFNLSEIFNGVKLGEVLGYTLYESVWYKDSQHTNPVTGIEKALSNVDLGQMVGGSFDVATIFGDTLLGEVFGYTKEDSVWMKGSSPATGIELRLADVSLGTMLNGGFDITSLLTGMKIGELLGYTATASGWENNSQPVTGIEKALADTDLGKLMSGEQTISGIFSGMYLGDALGYYKNSSDEKWYENYDSSNKTYSTVVTGINGIVANVDLGAVLSGNADFSTLFNGVYLGSLLDYTKGMDDKWYSDTSCINLVGGINQTLSNIDLGRLLGDPTYDITSVFSSSKLGDFLGYTYDETNHRWLDGSTPVSSFMNIVADRTISNMDGLLDDLTISDVMGYKTISGVLYEENGTTPVTGIMKTIATKKVTELGSCMSTLTVADALGYTDDNNDGIYQDEGGNTVTGFLGAVAPFKMEELSTKLASLKIGNIMGWDYDETTTTWYTDSTHTTAASGILKAFAGFTMDDMTDSSKMSAAIQGITLGEALGYTYNEGDGKWYMGTTPEDSSSFMSLIGLDTPIGQVGTKMTTTITTTTIQQFMDAEILDFDSDTQATLTTMFDGDSWKDCNLSTFITELCAKMQQKMLDLQSQISYYQNLIPH